MREMSWNFTLSGEWSSCIKEVWVLILGFFVFLLTVSPRFFLLLKDNEGGTLGLCNVSESSGTGSARLFPMEGHLMVVVCSVIV